MHFISPFKLPSFYFLMCLIAGILAAKYLPDFISENPLLILIIGIWLLLIGLIFLIWQKSGIIVSVFLFGALILFSMILYNLKMPDIENSGIQISDIKKWEGIITSVPEQIAEHDDNTFRYQFEIELESCISGDGNVVPCHGNYLVKLKTFYNPYKTGNRVLIEAMPMQTGMFDIHDSFDYNEFLYNNRLSGVFYIYSLRKIRNTGSRENQLYYNTINSCFDYLADTIEEYFDKEEDYDNYSLMMGLTLGQRHMISPEIIEQFRKTGVIHVLAISGLHVGIITGTIIIIFSILYIPKRWTLLLTIPILALYMVIVNFKPSVVRSVIMFDLFIIIYLSDRDRAYLNGLFIAAIIMLIINPGNLFLAGAQLSFLSVLGILLVMPLLTSWINKKKVNHKYLFSKPVVHIIDLIAISFAASLFVAPILFVKFRYFTFLVFITGVIVLPIISLVLSGGILILIFNLFWESLARIISHSVNKMLDTVLFLIERFSSIDNLYIAPENTNPWWIALYYLILLCSIVAIYKLLLRKKNVLFR